ncbi:hypothetical protein [Ramlibacter sp. AN1133]|uniref:hypothetical protein n=1 Tax=Ramlibacter sp. AN1133 TaxID=3133429 RepID=UPI0030C4BD96
MSATRSGNGPDDADAGNWATETLPMSVRKELLERELNKLGFRKAAAQGGSPSVRDGGSQQQGDAGSSHPQADGSTAAEHAD